MSSYSSSISQITPWHVSDSRPLYSHITTAPPGSRIVTFAGQVGRTVDGIVSPDKAEQVAEAYRNLSRCLDAAGATVKDILKLVYYVVGYDHQDRWFRAPTQAFLDGHLPASTLLSVNALALPEFVFEVEAVAAIPQLPPRNVDIVIVGAGLSGLTAAADLQSAGYDAVVVEARDRIGGKTWSRDIASGKQDVGAAWINDTNQSEMWGLVQRFGIETVVQNTKGRCIMQDPSDQQLSTFPYGGIPERSAEEGGVANMLIVRDMFESLCQKLDITDSVSSGKSLMKDYEKISMAEFARQESGGELAFAIVDLWCKAMLGLDAEQVGCLFFLDYCKSGGGLLQMRSDSKNGGQYLRPQQGTQTFSKCIASTLKPDTIFLSSPVRNIRQEPSQIEVISARGTFLAKKVIVSVPTPLYYEIEFTPPLPPEKLRLSQNTVLGYTAKFIAAYSKPWWRDHGLCGLVQSPTAAFCIIRDTSLQDQGLYALTLFAVGSTGRKWSKLLGSERKNAALDHIRQVFGQFVGGKEHVPDPIETVEHEWWKDQWSQGCPCPAFPPGLMEETWHTLRENHGDVHFVGTETSYEWKGYMEGASVLEIAGATIEDVRGAFDHHQLLLADDE